MRGTLVALACATLLLVPGCGSDEQESSGSEVSPPVPTIPQQTPAPRTSTDPTPPRDPPRVDEPPQAAPPSAEPETEPEPVPAPEPDPGGAQAPPATPPVDSPENDLPPPPGSEAEKFERFCEENPGAC